MTTTDLHLEIKQLIIEAANLEDVTPDDIDNDELLFGDSGVGLDSIDALEIGVALRQRFGVTLEAEDPNVKQYFASVRALASLVQERGRSRQQLEEPK